MKKALLKSILFVSLLLMTSCASGNYMQTVSFWHIGNFLQFALIAAIAAFLFILYDKMQSIDERLKQITDLLQGRHHQDVNRQPNTTFVEELQQSAPQQPAPQPAGIKCPECGVMVESGKTVCANCGYPLS